MAKFPNGVLPVTCWTTLSVDNRYLTHLLNLFFAWDSTIGRIFHPSSFLRDMKSYGASDLNFCSKFLVHAVLAVSHLYMLQNASPDQLDDIRARGRNFADEAYRMLSEARLHPTKNITLAQGLVLLWVYEIDNGKGHQSITLLNDFYQVYDAVVADFTKSHEAYDILNADTRTYREAMSFVIWGLFCLEMKVSFKPFACDANQPPQNT
jgi:hypothetical protein